MRSFTTGRTIRKALRWSRKGTTQDVQWVERQIESSVDYVHALADKAVKASIEFVNVSISFMLLLIW